MPANRIAVPTHTTNKMLMAAHSMGALGYSALLSSRALHTYDLFLDQDASVARSLSTHNEFTYTGIYSLYWEAGMSGHSYCYTEHNTNPSMDHFSSFPHLTVSQQSKENFTIFNAHSSGHILLSTIT